MNRDTLFHFHSIIRPFNMTTLNPSSLNRTNINNDNNTNNNNDNNQDLEMEERQYEVLPQNSRCLWILHRKYLCFITYLLMCLILAQVLYVVLNFYSWEEMIEIYHKIRNVTMYIKEDYSNTTEILNELQ